MVAAPPPPPELVEDVISEILLRLPPDEPQWLFRAAIVCKPWLRTLSDPAFLRRYRDFHGAPPLLGLVHGEKEADTAPGPRYVPTTAVPALPIPEPDTPFAWPWPLDCRHGRVLIREVENMGKDFLVCDPVTGDCHCVPQPEFLIESRWYNATAVFCAAVGCDHLDCHGGPFCVVITFTDYPETTTSAAMYSSEIGAWRAPVTLDSALDVEYHPAYVEYHRGPLIGDEIYFALPQAATIVKYDSANNFLTVVKPKPPTMDYGFVLMLMEDGLSLGLAAIEDSRLHLWSTRVSSEGTAEWVRCRVIDLEKMMPMCYASVDGFADGVGVIFIGTCVGLFMVELKSGRARKAGAGVPVDLPCFLPYMSFYTPRALASTQHAALICLLSWFWLVDELLITI